MFSEELLILASCLLRPMSRNSVLGEFGVRRFAIIHDEIRSRALWRWSMLESKWVGKKDRKSWVSSSRGDGLGNKRKWGYWEEWCTWRRVVDQTFDMEATRWQLRTEPWIPNQDERRVIKMSWSLVSKAAERSSRQTWYFLWSYCTGEVIVDVQSEKFTTLLQANPRMPKCGAQNQSFRCRDPCPYLTRGSDTIRDAILACARKPT